MADFKERADHFVKNAIVNGEITGIDHQNSFYDIAIKNTLERRFSKVAYIQVKDNNGKQKNIYLKESVPNKALGETQEEIRGRIISEFETTRKINAAFSAYSEFCIPETIAIYPEELIYIIGECPGITLSDAIKTSALCWSRKEKRITLLNEIQLIGNWLQLFQQKIAVKTSFSLEKMKEYCGIRLARIEKKGLLSERFSNEVLDLFSENNLRDIKDKELGMALAHCDFTPGNILVGNNGISVIDFARTQPWSPYLDISHLYHHIDLFRYKPIFSKKYLAQLKSGLLEGYGQPNLADNKLFKLFLVQHKLCMLSYFSRKNEHSFKSNMYHKIIIRDVKCWIKKLRDTF
jgi:thiamine kinase-like enzyme